MKYIKTYESFDIYKLYNDIKSVEYIDIDPYDEEDWDESEDGDIMYKLNKYMDIDFQEYDSANKLFRYKKLNRKSILGDLIKLRNRKITQYKVESSKIFKQINIKKQQFNKKLNNILKKGQVVNSERNISLMNIKNSEVDEFIIYHFVKNSTELSVDKYECKVSQPSSNHIKENNSDLFLDDMWDEHLKYKNDISVILKQVTYNIENDIGGSESLGYNLYYPQFEYLVNKNEIIIESKNIKGQITKEYNNITDREISVLVNSISRISTNINSVDTILQNKLKEIENKYPQIKKT